MKNTLILVAALAAVRPGEVLAVGGSNWVGPPPSNGSLGGDWNTATNWSPAVVPNSIGAAATIGTTAATTGREFTFSSNITIGSLSIVDPANSDNEFGQPG